MSLNILWMFWMMAKLCFYCMLIYLVQHGLLKDDWVEECPTGMWMQKQICKRAESLDLADWMEVTWQNEGDFVTSELERIYDPSIDALIIPMET
jgi:hypothetical protein